MYVSCCGLFYNESESWSRQIDLRNGLAFCSEGCRLTNKSRTAIYGRIENSGNTCPTQAGEKRQITRLEQWRRLRLISQLVEPFPLSWLNCREVALLAQRLLKQAKYTTAGTLTKDGWWSARGNWWRPPMLEQLGASPVELDCPCRDWRL